MKRIPFVKLMILTLGFIMVAFSSPSTAQEDETKDSYIQQQQDLNDFMQTLNSLKDASIEERIKVWEQFLEDHPDTMYKDQILDDLDKDRALLRAKEEFRMNQAVRDKNDYQYFKNSIASLAPTEQITRYEEYINLHKDSTIIDQIKADRDALKSSQATQPPAAVAPATPGQPPAQTAAPVAPLVPSGKTKNPNHALFLAAVPGLIVPGLGTFYAGQTATGVIVVLVRAGGIALGATGIAQDNRSLIITGGIAYGFSYIMDVVAAPIFAREYNEKHEKKAGIDVSPYITAFNKGPAVGIAGTF